MTPEELMPYFRAAWCYKTSAHPEFWSPDSPAEGQCLHTTLVAGHFLGGKVVHITMKVGEKSYAHFYNQLDTGDVIDFTASQLEGCLYHIERQKQIELGRALAIANLTETARTRTRRFVQRFCESTEIDPHTFDYFFRRSE